MIPPYVIEATVTRVGPTFDVNASTGGGGGGPSGPAGGDLDGFYPDPTIAASVLAGFVSTGDLTDETTAREAADTALQSQVDGKMDTGQGAGGVLSGAYPNPGFAVDMVEQSELAAALAPYLTTAAAAAGYQPLDSDLTAIAALTTTAFGRALLTLADAAAMRTAAGLGTLATQSGTFSGTSSGTNTGDQDLSSYATLAALAGYQPLDADLTAIAALTTTAYGRALLTLANDATLKALVAPTRPDYASWELAYSAVSGSWSTAGNNTGWRGGWITNSSSPVAGNYVEWAIEVTATGTYTLNTFHTGQTSGPTYQLSVGGVDVGAATATTTTNNVLARTGHTGISLTVGVTTLRCTIANTGNTTTAIRFGGVLLQRTA